MSLLRITGLDSPKEFFRGDLMGKKRNKKRKYSKKLKRVKGQSEHHILPRSRGGSSNPSNLLRLNIEKHECWHKIFGLRTIREVIELLKRVEEMKNER